MPGWVSGARLPASRDAGLLPARRLLPSRLTLGGLAIDGRSLAGTHGQIRVALPLSAVRSGGLSYHSQADSAGSIPVTRSIREKRCNTGESSAILPVGQRSPVSEISTRAITACHYHLGRCPYPSSWSFGLALVVLCPRMAPRPARGTGSHARHHWPRRPAPAVSGLVSSQRTTLSASH